MKNCPCHYHSVKDAETAERRQRFFRMLREPGFWYFALCLSVFIGFTVWMVWALLSSLFG